MGDGYLEPHIFHRRGSLGHEDRLAKRLLEIRGKTALLCALSNIDQTLTAMPSISAEALAGRSWLCARHLTPCNSTRACPKCLSVSYVP
jgi:hypothetical protein